MKYCTGLTLGGTVCGTATTAYAPSIDHNEQAYTKREFNKIETCEHAGAYQGRDGFVRIYCFKAIDKTTCPREKG